MPESKRVEIRAAKGRPMLSWVGKKPLRYVTAFPAQHVETFAPPSPRVKRGSPSTASWNDWPDKFPHSGLLFHGDNKEVLAHLLASGFRGKVKLIYIDPPFDSGADYVRKVSLRGPKGTAKLEGESYTLGEQIQYTDIWVNDNYLQFMYERLMLLKELMAGDGVIILHCDWRKSHHLRALLDETLGAGSFRNEIYWYFYNKMHDDRKDIFPRATNTLMVYSKGIGSTFHRIAVPRENMVKQLKRVKVDGVLVNLKDEGGKLVYQESYVKTLDNVWPIPLIPPADVRQKTSYPTQKPEALLDLAVLTYSNPGDLVLDGFIGSGTASVAAQRHGRRWIGCDINKGAIQTTCMRLQRVIGEQVEAARASGKQASFVEAQDQEVKPAQLSFNVYRVNDYDLQVQHNETVNIACEHIGITRTRSDAFFDGTLGRRLAKIVPFNHPLTPLDLEEVKRELAARPDEERDVVIVCLGKETTVDSWLDDWNRLRRKGDVPNKISVIELRTDPKYGKFIVHKPASARVSIARVKDKLKVIIKDFISPTIIERLGQQTGVVQPKIDDWRQMVDSVMIDPAYDGKVFNIALSDVPEKKDDFVHGEYELDAPARTTTVAVKITDMLGEEVLVDQTI